MLKNIHTEMISLFQQCNYFHSQKDQKGNERLSLHYFPRDLLITSNLG